MSAPLRPPSPAAPHLVGLEPGDARDLVPGVVLDGVDLSDVADELVELAGARLLECRVSGLRADEADLSGARLGDVALEGVDCPVLKAARGQWQDVRLTGRVGSLEAYEARWSSVHLVGARLSYVNLRGAEVADLLLTDCVVDELDLVGTRASRVALPGTRVGRLDVQHAELTDVDLRGAELAEVSSPEHLRGTTVSEEQLVLLAPLLAASLGIRVEER